MNYFVYLTPEESGCDDIPETGLHVPDDSTDIIFVPPNCLPIALEFWENLFPDVLIDDKRYYCVIISIDDLYEKLIESGNDSNMELDQSILEHSQYDGWEEGWAWNIDTMKFENRPRPSGQNHCWVHHTQSWESTCTECFKPDCPSVGIPLLNLGELYCKCEKCDECGFIYDNDECKCQASIQQHSVSSSDSCFVRCEHCHLKYDSSNQRQHDYHFFERCCSSQNDR
jgi:hypothetical protein